MLGSYYSEVGLCLDGVGHSSTQSIGLEHYSGDGGGIFLASEDFGRMFDNTFPACAFFFFF